MIDAVEKLKGKNEKRLLVIKGAPEIILDRCEYFLYKVKKKKKK